MAYLGFSPTSELQILIYLYNELRLWLLYKRTTLTEEMVRERSIAIKYATYGCQTSKHLGLIILLGPKGEVLGVGGRLGWESDRVKSGVELEVEGRKVEWERCGRDVVRRWDNEVEVGVGVMKWVVGDVMAEEWERVRGGWTRGGGCGRRVSGAGWSRSSLPIFLFDIQAYVTNAVYLLGENTRATCADASSIY